MKIGFLTPEYITEKNVSGGLANYLKKTACQLVRRGHQVIVFVSSDKDSEWIDDGVSIVEVKKDSFSHGVILKLLWASRKFRFLCSFTEQVFAAWRIAAAVRKEDKISSFDILQASSYVSPGLFLLRNRHIPVVCRISSHSASLRAAEGRKKGFRDLLTEWLELCQVNKADALFAPSEFLAETFSRLGAADVDVIRTPIDDSINNLDYSFYQNNLPEGLKYFLFFGTLSKVKGTDLLAHVIPRVVKRNPDIHFVFIGRDDGTPGGMKIFEYIKSYPNMDVDKIFYFPAISKRHLYPVIKASLAVIMPSRVDNYPNVCLEAQTMGVPVIATNNSSLEEMVVEGKTGFLAENGEPESIYQAIMRFLQMSREEHIRMKEEIAVHIQNISAEDRIGHLVKYYESVAGYFSKNK